MKWLDKWNNLNAQASNEVIAQLSLEIEEKEHQRHIMQVLAYLECVRFIYDNDKFFKKEADCFYVVKDYDELGLGNHKYIIHFGKKEDIREGRVFFNKKPRQWHQLNKDLNTDLNINPKYMNNEMIQEETIFSIPQNLYSIDNDAIQTIYEILIRPDIRIGYEKALLDNKLKIHNLDNNHSLSRLKI